MSMTITIRCAVCGDTLTYDAERYDPKQAHQDAVSVKHNYQRVTMTGRTTITEYLCAAHALVPYSCREDEPR